MADKSTRRFRDKRKSSDADLDNALPNGAGDDPTGAGDGDGTGYIPDDDPNAADDEGIQGDGQGDGSEDDGNAPSGADDPNADPNPNVEDENDNGKTPATRPVTKAGNTMADGTDADDIAVVNGDEFAQALMGGVRTEIASGVAKAIASLAGNPTFTATLGRLVRTEVAKAVQPTMTLTKAVSDQLDDFINHVDDRFDITEDKQAEIEKSIGDLASSNLVKAEDAAGGTPPTHLTPAPPAARAAILPAGQTSVVKGVVSGTAAPGGVEEVTPRAELMSLIAKAETMQETTGKAVPGLTDIIMTTSAGGMPAAAQVEALKKAVSV